MNALIVGTRKEAILDYLPDTFLVIDDGSLIDRIEMPERKAVTKFDVSAHSFNPLKDMSYKRARDFISVLDAVFPEGESTLTRKNSNFILLQSLLQKPAYLDKLKYPSGGASKEGALDAKQKIETLLLSPVLKSVLNEPTNMSFKGTVLARLDRATLGDFDAFVIANLLISQYEGPVVIPDFGFYACRFHTSLIRQDRLIAGINSFAEVPAFKHTLLLIGEKVGSHSTADDAKTLALYEGLAHDTNAYNDFIQRCIE